MRRPRFVRSLSAEEVSALEARYQETDDADERTRCQIVLLSHEGMTPPAIAKVVRRRLWSVHRVLCRYQCAGLARLRDRRRDNPGRERVVTRDWEDKLLSAIERDPHSLGVNRATWTAALLAEYLGKETGIAVGEERVRHYLHVHGYAPRRPTWTLAHKAGEYPQYERKRGQ